MIIMIAPLFRDVFLESASSNNSQWEIWGRLDSTTESGQNKNASTKAVEAFWCLGATLSCFVRVSEKLITASLR